MRRKLITVFLFALIFIAASGFIFETTWNTWAKAGSVTSGTDANGLIAGDANGLSGTRAKWAYMKATFGGADPNGGWIIKQQYENGVKIRWRASAVTTTGELELWGLTDNDDGEYIATVALAAPGASAQAATMGGYYFGNPVDANNTDTAASIRKRNCNALSRMGVFEISNAQNWAYIVVKYKWVSGGTISHDKTGY
jgi:hypothetical protein